MMAGKPVLFAALCLAINFPMAHADEEPPTVQVYRLTMDTALEIARGAIADCRKRGLSIGVTVVDRDGSAQAVLRDTVSPPLTLRISRQKAFTAANFQRATSELGNLADGPIGRVPGLTMAAGGVPVEVAGQMLGAVGVSGAPSGEIDEACARAGIEAVREDLEMSF